jgi:hypothetical protein
MLRPFLPGPQTAATSDRGSCPTCSQPLTNAAKKLGFQFRVGAGGFCRQTEKIDCLRGLADALQAGGTVALEVLAKLRRRVRERSKQEQFVKVL